MEELKGKAGGWMDGWMDGFWSVFEGLSFLHGYVVDNAWG